MNSLFDRQATRAALCIASALGGLFAAPSAFSAGGIKAVYVEPVLPSKPFSGYLPNDGIATGPGSGVLGITSVTAYNVGPSGTATIFIYATEVAGPTCKSAPINPASRRLITFVSVPLRSQIHYAFPSPLVVEPIVGAANGLTCLLQVTTNTVDLFVNGFSN